jgi:hypothetical protein
MISAFSPLKKYALTTDASMREGKENKWYKERKRERQITQKKMEERK